MKSANSSVNRRRFLVVLGASAAVGCGAETPKLISADDVDEGGGTPDTGSGRDSGDSGSVTDTGDTGTSADTGDTGTPGDTGDPDDTSWEAECRTGAEELSRCERTPYASEGPFFVEGVEERANTDVLGIDGQRMVVDLRVYELVDGVCTPVEGAYVDLWHCDDEGVYDMSDTHHCRARLPSAADGTACFIAPRPPNYGTGADMLYQHFHLHVHLDGLRVLTTQIFFEDDPLVTERPPLDPNLVLPVETLASGLQRVSLDLIFDRNFLPPP